MKKLFLIMLLVFISFSVEAQQDAQYTQYMYNTVSVNPAYAGSRGAMSIVALHRSQWVGLEGAPRTQTLSLHTPFTDSRLGLGVSIVNDALGPATEQYFNVDLSYTLPVSDKGKLAFGFKATANLLNVDFTKLTIDVPSDVLAQQVENRFSPNFGAGLYYYVPKFYIGLSVPNILKTEHYDDISTSLAEERMNFYFISGYVFDLSSTVKLKPTILGKYVSGAPLQADLSLNALINNKFTLGAAYRWSAAMSGLAGFQINEKLMIGYAYDWDTTELSNYNSGSHEIFIRFELFNTKKNMVSPRFF